MLSPDPAERKVKDHFRFEPSDHRVCSDLSVFLKPAVCFTLIIVVGMKSVSLNVLVKSVFLKVLVIVKTDSKVFPHSSIQ